MRSSRLSHVPLPRSAALALLRRAGAAFGKPSSSGGLLRRLAPASWRRPSSRGASSRRLLGRLASARPRPWRPSAFFGRLLRPRPRPASALALAFFAAAFFAFGLAPWSWSWPQPGPWTWPSSDSIAASSSSRVTVRSLISALSNRKSTTLSSNKGARSWAAAIGSLRTYSTNCCAVLRADIAGPPA